MMAPAARSFPQTPFLSTCIREGGLLPEWCLVARHGILGKRPNIIKKQQAAQEDGGRGLEAKPLLVLNCCRKRMWAGGNFGMAQTLFSNVECWLRHMSLDPKTGRDPDGIHLRSAEGLEAVDYFVPGYAVWAKLVEALADLGYDSNTLVNTIPWCSCASEIIF